MSITLITENDLKTIISKMPYSEWTFTWDTRVEFDKKALKIFRRKGYRVSVSESDLGTTISVRDWRAPLINSASLILRRLLWVSVFSTIPIWYTVHCAYNNSDYNLFRDLFTGFAFEAMVLLLVGMFLMVDD